MPTPATAPLPEVEATPPRATPPRARTRTAQPSLRLIHHMARSGGTVISKCLGCMSGIVLLSEIHPLGTQHFNPVIQAQRWFGLLSGQDLSDLRARGGRIRFVDAIGLIHQRSTEHGQQLVIRDWSHLDFTGVPFVAKPSFRLLTAEALASRFELRQVCTVRHPLDQWLSVSRLVVVQGRLPLDTFLAGYRRFAEHAARVGFMRYEDFIAKPAPFMKSLCARMHLRFDRHFAGRWYDYTTITGEVSGGRGGAEIQPVPRRPVEPKLLDALAANDDYRVSLDLLGYQHPEP
jgi:hypothetical protein